MKKIVKKIKNFKYRIFFDENISENIFFKNYLDNISKTFVIITSKNIKEKISIKIFNLLQKINKKVLFIEIEDDETNKNLKTAEHIYKQMLENNFLKDTYIISIGGGVISDISGFVASTYMRGIGYIIIPTTYLAASDAAIGGKNSLDCDIGKNMIGTIYHPKAVFIDFDNFKFLKENEIKYGGSEIFKIALVNNKKLFKKILQSKDISKEILIESIKSKLKIIKKDQNDKNFRKILNFGHTIAHAIEKESNYKISHAKAVYLGIFIESYISYKKKLLSFKNYLKISTYLRDNDLLDNISTMNIDNLIIHISLDKKNVFENILLSLLKKIGKSVYNVRIDKKFIKNCLTRCLEVK